MRVLSCLVRLVLFSFLCLGICIGICIGIRTARRQQSHLRAGSCCKLRSITFTFISFVTFQVSPAPRREPVERLGFPLCGGPLARGPLQGSPGVGANLPFRWRGKTRGRVFCCRIAGCITGRSELCTVKISQARFGCNLPPERVHFVCFKP